MNVGWAEGQLAGLQRQVGAEGEAGEPLGTQRHYNWAPYAGGPPVLQACHLGRLLGPSVLGLCPARPSALCTRGGREDQFEGQAVSTTALGHPGSGEAQTVHNTGSFRGPAHMGAKPGEDVLSRLQPPLQRPGRRGGFLERGGKEQGMSL